MTFARTLLRPRWLALLALLVVVVVVFVRLGSWQLGVAHDAGIAEQLAEQAAQPEVPVQQLLTPHRPFPAGGTGRPVVASGHYDVAEQFLVSGRLLDGRPVLWVVTPLVVDETGAALAVVRGAVDDPSQADRPPATPLVVHGTLAPAESPAPAPAATSGSGSGSGGGEFPVLGSVDLARLANTWPGELYNGFVFATSELPVVTSPPVVAVPPPSFVSDTVDWRNFGYALQWWVFAAFAVFLFVKMVLDDARADAASARGGDPADDPGDDPGQEHPGERPTLGHHV